MSRVVGVRFQRVGEVHYFDPGDLEVNLRDRVVVDTDTGSEIGWVVVAPDQVVYSEVKGPLRPVLKRVPQEELGEGGGADLP